MVYGSKSAFSQWILGRNRFLVKVSGDVRIVEGSLWGTFVRGSWNRYFHMYKKIYIYLVSRTCILENICG